MSHHKAESLSDKMPLGKEKVKPYGEDDLRQDHGRNDQGMNELFASEIPPDQAKGCKRSNDRRQDHGQQRHLEALEGGGDPLFRREIGFVPL